MIRFHSNRLSMIDDLAIKNNIHPHQFCMLLYEQKKGCPVRQPLFMNF